MISVLIYCLIYFSLAIVGFIGIFRYLRKQYVQEPTISLSEITVIIPFRNEENRILSLLQSLNQAKELPASILFIDDHSSDNTVEIIKNQLTIPHQIIASSENGKKQAIALGIELAQTEYILTLDADVWFESDYFSKLKQLKSADMHILPVKMSANGWKKLFELDVYMINGINLIATGLKRPIAASGANLLFSKNVYLTSNSLSSHAHIASGDDQFLLADFVKQKKEIQLHGDAKFAVTTDVPTTLKELISQRLRWILKTPKVPDSFALKIGFIQLTTTISFLVLGILTATNPLYFLILLGIKTMLDSALMACYFRKIGKFNYLFLIPIYEVILPIYTILLAILALFFKPKWKGR